MLSTHHVDLAEAVDQAFAERSAVIRGIADDSKSIAQACHDMANRFSDGGRLLVFGNGVAATDAEHIAVEFVHPVIVGKRALPALSLATDAATILGVALRDGIEEVFAHQVRTLGRQADIALGVSADGNCENVVRALQAARSAGMLTVALAGGDGGALREHAAADYCFVIASDDARIVKEGHVTTYHVLWEMVHAFLESPGAIDQSSDAPNKLPATADIHALYPFLYGGTDPADVFDSVVASTEEKVEEIIGLRSRFGDEQRNNLIACANEMAKGFANGATLWALGNGGSSSDAQEVAHIFLDPVGLGEGLPLPAVCLTNDVAVTTALSNDIGYDVVFARQIKALGRPGDIVVGLSTSGGSENVLGAFAQAKRAGLLCIGLSGYGGGRMAKEASLDFLFAVPSASVHRVQEVQTTTYHVLWELTQHILTTARLTA